MGEQETISDSTPTWGGRLHICVRRQRAAWRKEGSVFRLRCVPPHSFWLAPHLILHSFLRLSDRCCFLRCRSCGNGRSTAPSSSVHLILLVLTEFHLVHSNRQDDISKASLLINRGVDFMKAEWIGVIAVIESKRNLIHYFGRIKNLKISEVLERMCSSTFFLSCISSNSAVLSLLVQYISTSMSILWPMIGQRLQVVLHLVFVYVNESPPSRVFAKMTSQRTSLLISREGGSM